MNLLKKCKICGGKSFNFLFKQRDKNLNFSDKFSLYKCKNCRIIFLNPQPTDKELEKYYPKEKYYSLGKIEKNSFKTKLKLKLYKIYFNKNKNFLKKILYSPLKYKVRGAVIQKGKKLLDIGCGSGQFLYEMKQFGMDIYGVEPSDFDEKIAKEKKLNILKSDLIKANYPSNFFDIITINHVLEHTNDPLKTIKEIYRILKKRGTLIIGVPNSNALAYSLFKKNWYQLDVPRHLFNFSDKNLKELLQKEGFKIKKIRYNSRPSQFVVSLYFVLNIKQRKGICYKILKGVFLPLTWIVNALKIGDQVEIFVKKK